MICSVPPSVDSRTSFGEGPGVESRELGHSTEAPQSFNWGNLAWAICIGRRNPRPRRVTAIPQRRIFPSQPVSPSWVVSGPLPMMDQAITKASQFLFLIEHRLRPTGKKLLDEPRIQSEHIDSRREIFEAPKPPSKNQQSKRYIKGPKRL